MIDLISDFRKKLASGPVFGPFAKSSDPALVECAGHAGFDFIILDMEHGPNSVQTIQDLIRAAQLVGLLPVVRVEEGSASAIGKVLDVGAGGIEIPQVTCARDIQQIVRQARFAPEGMRGVCRFVRAADYSALDRQEYFRRANQALIIAQLEGTEAIGNLEQIIDAGGADVLFIGPYDLSQSLGLPGQVNHPAVEEKMQQIIDRCWEKGAQVGTFADSPAMAAKWIQTGVRYLSYSVDVGIYYESCRRLVAELGAIPVAAQRRDLPR